MAAVISAGFPSQGLDGTLFERCPSPLLTGTQRANPTPVGITAVLQPWAA